MKAGAYYTPNGREIRERRKIKEWLAEDLADAAGLGVSTVKRSERSQKMQLRSLLKIAKALVVDIEVIVPSLRDPKQAQATKSTLRVFGTWSRVEQKILTAEQSITIIDSYFGEYGRLGLVLKKRAINHEPLPSMEVYMASPEMDFGAQRQREAKAGPTREAGQQMALSEQLEDSARNSYEAYFHTLAENIKSVARPYTGKIDVFEYHCMPSLRIIAIDDFYFFFGWFPLFAQNPNHTCFYLKDDDLDENGAILLREIRFQIEGVKAVSEPMLDSAERLRLNRHGTIL